MYELVVFFEDYRQTGLGEVIAKFQTSQMAEEYAEMEFPDRLIEVNESLPKTFKEKQIMITVGTQVIVTPEGDDLFDHEFQGRVVDIQERYGLSLYAVVDQDDQCFLTFLRQLKVLSQNA